MDSPIVLTGVIAIFFIINGLVDLFAPDIAWSMAQWNNSMFGRSSERTPAWESWRIFFGIMSLLFGLFIGWMVVGAHNAVQARAAEAKLAQKAASLNDAISYTQMEFMRRNATIEPQAYDTDNPDMQIYYGACHTSSGFYILILNWRDLGDVAYTTRERPCIPPSLYTMPEEIVTLGRRSLGGRWVQLTP